MEDSKDTRFVHYFAAQRHEIRRQKSMALFFCDRGSIILQISLKSALEKFSILLFDIALGVCYLAMVMSDLCLFKTPNTC